MRIPVVSRTFRGPYITALVLDVDTGTSEFYSIFFPRKPAGKKAEQKIRDRFREELPENKKFVEITNEEVVTMRYAMTEDEFVKQAKPVKLLPGTETENDTEE